MIPGRGALVDPRTEGRLSRRNMVLTGPPRSGTTLACHLLNKLPGTVALHEPISPGKLADLEDGEAMLDDIERFFRRMRRMIRTQGVVISKHVGGEVPDNPFDTAKSEGGLRSPKARRGQRKGKIAVGKELERGFRLVIKHPAMFSALLPILVKRFPAYAIVRNPLAVLGSWNSLDHDVRNGHSPAAERYDRELERRQASIEDRVERQLQLLSWYYERCRVLPGGAVIRYEEMVNSGGRALAVIDPEARSLDEPLSNQNTNAVYDRGGMLELGERLLGSEGAYWHFYPRRSVEELLERIG
jgi:hypothetical protein